jgi:parvulin-like peptidyl-prolyl isomerase
VKRALAAMVVAAAMMSGCASQAPPPPLDSGASASSGGPVNPPPPVVEEAPVEVIATVRGQNITEKELEAPLIEAYGLNMLLELVQLDLAKQEADRQSITVSPQDVENEVDLTLSEFQRATNEASATTEPTTQPSGPLSATEREKLLALLLSGQRITRPEFDIAMERNAYLRKLVAPQATADLTDENLHERFNAVYGEKARVRFIRLPDMMSVARVEDDLKAGQTFEEEMSLHAYDSVGRASTGVPPPFTRKDAEYPLEFREVVFNLKPGQVSDPVQIKDAIYLVQLIEFIPPRYVKFEDVKDWLKQDLYEREVQARLKQYLESLAQVARETMEIRNPVLKQQWDANLKNAEDLRQQLQREQAASTTTRPADQTSSPAN